MIPETSDIIVIGGGPAGSMTAALLRLKGYDVVLLEKQQHPRYAVGESLIPDFWKYCDLVGVTEKIEAENFIQKSGGLINWQAQPKAHNFSDFGYDRPALHVERDRFDFILLDHARSLGVHVFETVAAQGIRFDEDAQGGTQVQVTGQSLEDNEPFHITGRYVVDASGQNSLLARQFGLREIDEDFRFMSIWGYFEGSRYFGYDGVAYEFADLRRVRPTTYVSSIDETGDAGWSWHITLRENTSVGLVLPRAMMKDGRPAGDSWEAYFEARCRSIPILSDLLAPATFIENSLHITRDYSYKVSRISGPGYFMVGDAAGFVDPIFSVGCVISLYGAFAAAWAIDHCLRDPASAARYQDLFTRQLRGRLEIARNLALPRYRPAAQVSVLAQDALKMQRQDVQDLMQVVATLTTRSDNFTRLQGEITGTDTPNSSESPPPAAAPEKPQKVKTFKRLQL